MKQTIIKIENEIYLFKYKLIKKYEQLSQSMHCWRWICW